MERKKINMILRRTTIAAALMVPCMAAHADFFGLLSGRSANPANNPALSVEGAFITGSDYQNIGARVNYNVNELLTVYGDFGLSELDPADGISFGAGAFYYLPVLDGFDSSVQASAHFGALDVGNFDSDVTVFGTAFLVSPQTPLTPAGLNWYANAGVSFLNVDIDTSIGNFSDDSTEIQIGGGVYMPLGPGTVYGGLDLIDEVQFGVGYRYGLQ